MAPIKYVKILGYNFDYKIRTKPWVVVESWKRSVLQLGKSETEKTETDQYS